MPRVPVRPSVVALAGRWLARRRFPTLFALAAVALVVDVLLPDGLPFLDELLLAVLTAVLGAWRARRPERPGEPPPGDAPPR